MKKFVKVILIVIAGIMFIGMFFSIVGFIIGGRNISTQFVVGLKNSILREQTAEKFNLDMNLDDINFSDWDNSKHTVYNGNISKMEISDETEVTDLYLKIAACEFLIKESEDNSYYIDSSRAGDFRCYLSNGTLHFEGIDEDIAFLGNTHSIITLYVPKDVILNTVTIESGAASISVTSLLADKITVELGAGEFVADKILANQSFEFEIGAGSIEIKELYTEETNGEIGAGDCEIGTMSSKTFTTDIGMGSMEVRNLITEELIASCAMGDISIDIIGDESDYAVEASCAAGDVQIGKNGNVVLGSASYNKNGKYDISVDCALGSININFHVN